MDRKMCETLINEKIEEIKEIYNKYNPDGVYLSVTLIDDYVTFNNRYWADGEKPISFSNLRNGENDV